LALNHNQGQEGLRAPHKDNFFLKSSVRPPYHTQNVCCNKGGEKKLSTKPKSGQTASQNMRRQVWKRLQASWKVGKARCGISTTNVIDM